MSASKRIQTTINGTMQALNAVIPLPLNIKPPTFNLQPFELENTSVEIKIIGDIKGSILFNSSPEFFSSIGASMYGMPLEGEMLQSFTCELGNMVAGNLCGTLAENNVKIDITPPNFHVGVERLFKLQHAIHIPVSIPEIGHLNIILTIDEKQLVD